MRRQNIRWLAGLLEGEGSFCVCRQPRKDRANDRYEAVVAAASTDRDVLKEVCRLINTKLQGPYKPKGKPTYKPVYQTRLNGGRAKVLMRRLYPYMSDRRKSQIRETLSHGNS